MGLMLFVATMFFGCSSQSEMTEVPVVVKDPVVVNTDDSPIQLLLASTTTTDDSRTRLGENIVQTGSPYRSISKFRFIALEKDGETIHTQDSDVDDPSESIDKTDSRYYHSGYCIATEGVNAFLAYAKADDATPTTKYNNGSLIPEIKAIPKRVSSIDEIRFDLQPIILDEAYSGLIDDAGIPYDAWTLANALTDIAQTQIEEVYWSASTNKDLKALFINFTNSGYDLPGSAASVKKWIEAVQVAADNLSFDDGTIEEQIRQEIFTKASAYLDKNNAISIFNLNYPQNINLPDGAAAVRWADTADGKKFVPQLQTTTLDDINSVSRFVYPPALYYFVESGIWTTSSKLEFNDYNQKSTWKGNDANSVQGYIKSKNNGTEITEIREDTKTVAVADPLQYAVAQLQVKVKVADDADETNLKYNGTATIPYTDNGTNHYFRLTGVIIGGQRTVGYNFKPLTNSDMDVKFVYDSQVPENFVLKKNSTDVFNTLVLQSYDGEDVNVILEFEYTGNTAFKCLNGWVYPNTRFYLVGEVKLSTGTPSEGVAEEDKEDVKKRVFTQDRITAIQMTVSSLEKAYNVLPSILSKNLEIGVLTTPQWIAATPADAVILE